MFSSILNGSSSTLSIAAVGICLCVSVLCGLMIAFAYKKVGHPAKGFLQSLVILPAMVQMVILMVNGNLGVGVAVAGSFSLIRFRSLPGKASDILIVFLAMAAGLATGMGYIYFAMAFTFVLLAVYCLLSMTSFLDGDTSYRNIRITIPEDLEYGSAFEEIFAKYSSRTETESVRTVNLGTMYQITYEVHLKDPSKEKEMIDAIRVRNGNLPVISSKQATVSAEL